MTNIPLLTPQQADAALALIDRSHVKGLTEIAAATHVIAGLQAIKDGRAKVISIAIKSPPPFEIVEDENVSEVE